MKQESYTCFNDYPEHIQKEANEIFENEEPLLQYFVDLISEFHIGDCVAVELVLLSIASLFVENTKPIHQHIKGDMGSGKTNLLQNTLKIVPERYIHKLNNITPEYLYNIRNRLNFDYNIFLLDNIEPTPETIAMLKIFTDNNLENKIFIPSKQLELELPGKNLFLCIFNNQDIDKELEDQLLPNLPSENLEYELNRVGLNEILWFRNNSVSLQQKYQMANAVFELIISESYKVFNIYLLDNIRNYLMYQKPLDIQRFVSLVEARALYFIKQYENVDNIILGTWDDVDIVNRMLQEIVTMRDYNLTIPQKKFLRNLRVYDDDLFNKERMSYKRWDPKTTAAFFPTYDQLSYKLGISENTLLTWVKKGKDNLEELGLVKPMKIDYKKRNSKVLLYLNPKARNIRRSMTGFTETENNRKIEDILKDEYTSNDILKIFLDLSNSKNIQEKKESIITALKKRYEK